MNQGLLQVLLVAAIWSFSSGAPALEGLTALEKKLVEKNQQYLSLENQVAAEEAISNASNFAYYPSLKAVGGWANNKTDETKETGSLAYLEGKLNLFSGFKDQAFKSLREIDHQVASINLRKKQRELRFQLVDLVSDMIISHKLKTILDEEYKVSQSQKQMAAKKVSAGLTGNVDNLEFELRENELSIEKKQIEQKHLELHQKFISIFGSDISDSEMQSIDFSKVEKLISVPSSSNYEKSLDYESAELIATRSELEKKEIKAEYLPAVDFVYAAGRITPSEAIPMNFNESKYSLLITIPLFSGFSTYYKTKAANYRFAAAEKLKQQLRNEVKARLNILQTKISELGIIFEINEKKLATSQKYFDLTLAEYKRGIKNSPDLVAATERLFGAKKKRYELLKELEIAKVELENLF